MTRQNNTEAGRWINGPRRWLLVFWSVSVLSCLSVNAIASMPTGEPVRGATVLGTLLGLAFVSFLLMLFWLPKRWPETPAS